jgi:hypothetical protein
MFKKDINLVGLCSLTLSSNLVNMHLLVFDHFQVVSTLMSKEWVMTQRKLKANIPLCTKTSHKF